MSRLLIHESPLQILPSLAVKIGLNEAIVLQQLHYWLHPDHNKNIREGTCWVYNSYEQWQKQFPFWSKETVKRAIYALEKQNLILSRKFSDDKFDHRKWYSINYETLQQLEGCHDRWDQVDPIEGADVNDRSGQNDTIGQVRLTQPAGSRCYDHYKEQRLHSETTAEKLCARAEIVQEMVEIWNQTFPASTPVQLTPLRKTKLSMILSTHFDNNINNWQQFCASIKGSPFLQDQGSRGWRATLDWCVEEANLFKILEGNYEDKDQAFPSPPPEANSLRRSQDHIQTLSDPQHQQIARGICAQLGTTVYNSWFQDMSVAHRDGSKIVLSVPTQFMRDYIETHYFDTLQQLVQPLYPGLQQLVLVVAKAITSQPVILTSPESSSVPHFNRLPL